MGVLVSLFGFTAITMAFGHLHEVICRPKSLEEWAISNKLERLQAHLIGYVPQCFAWWLVRHRLPGREEPDADLRLRHRLRRAAHLLGLRPRAAHRLAPPARQVLPGRDRVHVALALRQGRARPARAEQRPCARQLHRYLCLK